MAVKVAPAPGSVIEETKRTRVIPPNSPDNEGEKPWRILDKWDYIASLTPEQWGRESLVVYLYRYDDKGNPWGIGKFTGALDEFKVLEMFGGGRFNLKMKRGPQLIINDDFQLEGPARTPGVNGAAAVGTVGTPSEGALLTTINALIEELRAARGGTLATDAIRSAMTLQGQVFGAGVEAVKSTLSHVAPAAPQANSMDDLNKALMQAVIAKILNPSDPIESFSKMATAMKALPGFGGGGTDKTGIALELVRQVPTIANTLVQGATAWRMAEESRERQIALTRGVQAQPPINVTPASHSNVVEMPAPAAPAAAAAPAPAPQVQVEVPQMPIETLEQMLCNIIADPGLSIDQAANEACALIERSMPGMTDQMVVRGEEFLMGLFRERPVLQQVANHPRLPEFVKKFIEVVKAAPVVQAPNPAAPVA
jgi:hypothetical protein